MTPIRTVSRSWPHSVELMDSMENLPLPSAPQYARVRSLALCSLGGDALVVQIDVALDQTLEGPDEPTDIVRAHGLGRDDHQPRVMDALLEEFRIESREVAHVEGDD